MDCSDKKKYRARACACACVARTMPVRTGKPTCQERSARTVGLARPNPIPCPEQSPKIMFDIALLNSRRQVDLLARRRHGGTAAWPLAVRAQQPAMPVIGYLGISSPEAFGSRLHAFRQGLSENGYGEGRNVTIEYRWAEGQIDRLPVLASDLVGRRPSAIVAAESIAGALAVKAATTTIPIVFEIGLDPVAAGLVPGLSRPGGNVTGVTSLNVEVNPKRLELLHELVPNVKAVALLVNPANPSLTEPLLPQRLHPQHGRCLKSRWPRSAPDCHPTWPADEEGSSRHDDPRLQAPWLNGR